jgi:hypothetical protein
LCPRIFTRKEMFMPALLEIPQMSIKSTWSQEPVAHTCNPSYEEAKILRIVV